MVSTSASFMIKVKRLLFDSKVGLVWIFILGLLAFSIYRYGANRNSADAKNDTQRNIDESSTDQPSSQNFKKVLPPVNTSTELAKSETQSIKETLNGSAYAKNPLKGINFLDTAVSENVIGKAPRIIVTEHKQKVKDVSLFYRQTKSFAETELGTVLLLHGQAFSSKNWNDIQTLQLLAGANYRVAAVDLPGYGLTGGSSLAASNREAFLLDIMTSLDMKKPVLVSPSMSGAFSLPVLLHHPETLSGYVPIAPAGTDEYTSTDYAKIKVPTLIVYGANDTGLGIKSLRDLKNLPNSEEVQIPNAGHAAYLDQPDIFHGVLIKFLWALDQHNKA